jgi:hypothetical protein
MGSADVNAGDTILASQQNDLRDDVIDQFTAADEIFVGSGVDAGAVATKMTQAQAEAGTEDVVRGISALRIAQAIAALETVSVQATQAAIEAETDENTYIPPDLIKHSPGVSKAFVRVLSTGSIVSGSYNITSTAKNSTGDYNVTFNVDFSNTNYLTLLVLFAATGQISNDLSTNTVTARHLRTTDSSGSNIDAAFGLSAYGDQ